MGNSSPKPLLDANLQHRPVASRQYYTLPSSSTERRASAPPVNISIESPRFHPQAKGKNIRLDSQLRRATRKSSFCNGITFSQRPLRLYEQVRLRLSAVHSGWSGALRFGFTSMDPGDLAASDIPKYACPDLVTRPGYWAKALPERLALRDNVLAFWADRHGRVFYSINDGEPVLFHCGLSVGCPLWAIIDIYGITQEVTLLESTFAESMTSSRLSTARISAYLPQSNHDSANYSNNQLETNQAAAAKIATLQLSSYNQLIPCCSSTSSSSSSTASHRAMRYLPSPLDSDLHFHPIRGSDIILSADRSAACIHFLDSSRTLVFSDRPLHMGTVQSSPMSTSPSGSPGGTPDDSDSDLAFSVNRSSSASESSLVTAPSSPLSPPLSPALLPSELPLSSKNGECTVCFDQEVDTVIYTCGHMCLCNDCGLKLKKQINACCPICRRPIKDVIKTYRP
ncbi:E3 ubiquitin-protein ligase NEURL1B isoform X2 [Scleropages formosus]|uniref:E3 ubiquitin-protein ligase NEURL1B isoform X2 n=1 Tax=Scleropages formosus TaxID=113540 RepID=UPI000878A242|nr:E3 ubiquitin-protein ligase NEURL1B isoform X2 [Scleropages formosus]